ncbi:ABC transporter permease [Brevibacillus parabrevis]|nr:ABC transporter permease [Brevibacillus parabrevis]
MIMHFFRVRKIARIVLSFFFLCSLYTIYMNFVLAAPNLHGIAVATVDLNKELAPEGQYDILTISGIEGQLGATISQIEINGVIDSNRVLGFADTNKKADRGWYFVDNTEAPAWINRLDGNPNYILGGNANVYSKKISAVEAINFQPYQAYNLAELATASGGAGYTIGDNLEPNGNGYISVGHFRTTPQPTGQVSTNKTKYEVNEQVTISANATDYSYYDRGILVWSLSVVNKTTGRGYHSFVSNEEIRDQSGYVPVVSETSTPKPFVWTNSYQYKPVEAGLYEVTLTITDRHHRSRQGSPSINVSTPYTYQFTVGDASPIDPKPPVDPEPSGCKRTTMDLRIEEEKTVRELLRVADQGETITVEKYATIIATAKKPGSFTKNGVAMQTGSGDNRKVGITEAPESGTFKIAYTSEDKTECWEKSIAVKRGGQGVDQCPIVMVNGKALSSGATIELSPGEEIRFKSTYRDAAGEVNPASILWDVTKPDGTVETLPRRDKGDRAGWVTYNSDTFRLPYTDEVGEGVTLDKGKTYRVKLNYNQALWRDRPECDWQITIKIRDISCSIAEQERIRFKRYGEQPSQFPPGGESFSDFKFIPFYKENFTLTPEGYQTHMRVAASSSGTWYVERNNERKPLGQKLGASEQQAVVLPEDIEVGEQIKLVFISETGCIREFVFTVQGYGRCYKMLISMETLSGQEAWTRPIQRGETIRLQASDFPDKRYDLMLFTSEDTKMNTQWLDPVSLEWKFSRDGRSLPSDKLPVESHWIRLPDDDVTDEVLPGLYMVAFYGESNETCDGYIFIEIEGADTTDKENLLILKESFAIAPKQPQAAGTTGVITFQIKNAGKLKHDTKLAVRWDSSAKETMLDVDGFKPGEVRTIKVPTQYPQKSEDFIAHLNPAQNQPENETNWADNRAKWPVKIVGGNIPQPPGGGEDYEGGEIGLEIYDSDGRQLQKLRVHADGVWEREPAKIRVVIDQTKINEGYQKTQQQINQKILDYTQQLEKSVSGEEIKNVKVTANPGWIADAKSLAVYTPAMLDLQVTGPGVPEQWQVASTSMGGEFVYTGTTVPTQTTWRQVLQNQKYKAEINGFVITMNYKIDFALSYDVCTKDEDDNETCEAQQAGSTMTGRYTITVKGGERLFEVFEPNATSSVLHTAEWAEYHGRDRYPDSTPLDFYAGERILARVELQDRHRHPVSGQFPLIASAKAWISETGRRQTSLQSLLDLRAISSQRWGGPSYAVAKLGQRETGVDTPLMGDKQYGFEKGASYEVYYQVQFRFGVNKGFSYWNKTTGQGHEHADYRVPFRIIANAWERQGIRNHSTQ